MIRVTYQEVYFTEVELRRGAEIWRVKQLLKEITIILHDSLKDLVTNLVTNDKDFQAKIMNFVRLMFETREANVPRKVYTAKMLVENFLGNRASTSKQT